jgi:hypothetical protein
VAVFAFSPTILLRCSRTGTLNNGALCVNEIKELRVSIFYGIISAEDFNVWRSFGQSCDRFELIQSDCA